MIKGIKKKGSVEISLTELIGAVLAVIIILALVYVIAKITGVFLSEKDYDSTVASFEVLTERIEGLIKDRNYASSNLLYFLDNSYILVGFSYKDSESMGTCQKGAIFKDAESLSRSRNLIGSLCENKACLCIYKDTVSSDFDKDLQRPLKCEYFDKNVVFLAPSYQDIFCGSRSGWHPEAYEDYYKGESSYKFLVLYGLGTKEIYLDKYESKDGNIFIFMGEYTDSRDAIKARAKFAEENYEKAPKPDDRPH